MTFSESSGMIRVAKINQKLLDSMWQSWNNRNIILKLPLLGPLLFYSVMCIFFIVFFYCASVIDVIPYIISRIANAISSTADRISHKNMGFFSLLFAPIFVFFLAILTTTVLILPKAVRMGDD